MTDHLGFGFMVQVLSNTGEGAASALQSSIGKVITKARIDDEANDGDGALVLEDEDGGQLFLFDNARSCCEARYLTCDDDLDGIVGATLLGVEVREVDGVTAGEYDEVHEQSFMIVNTSVRPITVAAHNEHNGYYGGIMLDARYEAPQQTEGA